MDESRPVEMRNSSSDEKPRISVALRIGWFAWYSAKKAVYMVFIIATVMLILIGLDKFAELALSRTYLGHVYPKDFAIVKRDLTKPVSHYDYDLTPGICFPVSTKEWRT